jgi:DNA ligase-1
MARREFLQLAKKYNPEKSKVAGYLISEKLDGSRCFWDGGVSRGMATVDAPWASIINPKTGARKPKIKPVATGLWSRYGNPIMAPDWFLDDLPPTFLDGELWAGRGMFQLCRSIVAGDKPDPRFDQIQYAVYGSPPIASVFMSGEIKNSNFHCHIDCDLIRRWIANSAVDLLLAGPKCTFSDELDHLDDYLGNSDFAFTLNQTILSADEQEAHGEIEAFLSDVLDNGGEGVVIRDPNAIYMPKRVNALLKYKPFDDDEGFITGFTSGRKTDKGSKHLGKIGALILDFDGKRLELSGLTDIEREFLTEEMCIWAAEHPGVDMPSSFHGKHFKLGQQVTFKYRELSDDGIPKEARYWRKRGVE